MKEIKTLVKSEKLKACILIDQSDEIAWCVYHDDDEAERLTFTKNLTCIEDIEYFENTLIEEIEEHLNKYGFEIESEEEFGDVLYFKSLGDEYRVKFIEVEFSKYCTLKFNE